MPIMNSNFKGAGIFLSSCKQMFLSCCEPGSNEYIVYIYDSIGMVALHYSHT